MKNKDILPLIEACGEDFRWLKKRGHGDRTVWLAQGRQHPVTKDIKMVGATPTEALEKLVNYLSKDI